MTPKEQDVNQMTNLYTAEYKGKMILCEQTGEAFAGFYAVFGIGQRWVHTTELTNIREAKAVPADAIVLNPAWVISKYEANGGGLLVQGAIEYKKQLYESYEITTPTPMVEPKGFGAIVEAKVDVFIHRYRFIKISEKLWMREGKSANEPHYYWSKLRNPTPISEGVE